MHRCCALFLLGAGALAQAPAKLPVFDVASVRQLRGPQALGYGSEKILVHAGSLTMYNARLRAAIRWAYGLQEYQVEAPAWMGSPGYQGREMARFEIDARASEGAPVEQLRLMLQALLAERFHLAVHRQTREINVFVLTALKDKPGLRPADDSTVESTATGNDSSFAMHHTSMAEFAEFLAGPLQVPVLDRTNRAGRFEITIDLKTYGRNLEEQFAMLPRAIEEQLGLKLARRKMPMEFLVVDHADKTPTEN